MTNINELRKEYRRIANVWSLANTAMSMSVLNTIVKANAGESATPGEMVKAAKEFSVPCGRCAATGRYQGRGNGGTCYRCGGKGEQDYADAERNFAYDRHAISEACSF